MKLFYILAVSALFMAAPIRLSAAPPPELDHKCREYARMQACTYSAYKTGRPCLDAKSAYMKCVAAKGNI